MVFQQHNVVVPILLSCSFMMFCLPKWPYEKASLNKVIISKETTKYWVSISKAQKIKPTYRYATLLVAYVLTRDLLRSDLMLLSRSFSYTENEIKISIWIARNGKLDSNVTYKKNSSCLKYHRRRYYELYWLLQHPSEKFSLISIKLFCTKIKIKID